MLQQIKTILLKWYSQNQRELPWRTTKDPYFIWLSEIILQQTRVQQGLSYYQLFTEKFPTIFDLANADEQTVLNTWQGLGYYSRARNLHATSRIIVHQYKGVFPSSFEEIKSLKGIGNYTAAAISSFAFDLPYAVVDGNVYRVLSRVFDEDSPIDSSAGQKLFQNLANNLLNTSFPANHNQAIMEFGALQCVPVNPNCDICVLNQHCLGRQNNRINVLPVKEKKTKVSKVQIDYSIHFDENKILLRKRLGKGIWQHLYEFPHCIDMPKDPPVFSETHLLSHQKLTLNYYRNVNNTIAFEENGLEWVNIKDLESYPKPKPIQSFIDNYLDELNSEN
ncbi:MAG: A/G-specific adenine glycosylase [Bacteroidetes bacterium]|nr:A/G-specific adenine glycosylase [Bacteroidota bacterium]